MNSMSNTPSYESGYERGYLKGAEAERKRWEDRLRLLIGRYRERVDEARRIGASAGARTTCDQVIVNLEEIIEDLTREAAPAQPDKGWCCSGTRPSHAEDCAYARDRDAGHIMGDGDGWG